MKRYRLRHWFADRKTWGLEKLHVPKRYCMQYICCLKQQNSMAFNSCEAGCEMKTLSTFVIFTYFTYKCRLPFSDIKGILDVGDFMYKHISSMCIQMPSVVQKKKPKIQDNTDSRWEECMCPQVVLEVVRSTPRYILSIQHSKNPINSGACWCAISRPTGTQSSPTLPGPSHVKGLISCWILTIIQDFQERRPHDSKKTPECQNLKQTPSVSVRMTNQKQVRHDRTKHWQQLT